MNEHHLSKIFDESLPQATREQHCKQAQLNLVFKLKRQIRQLLRLEAHNRAGLKAIPKPVQGRFCNRQIAEQRRWLAIRLQTIKDDLIVCGEQIWTLFESLDTRTTLHEKAQLFGVHHSRVARFEREGGDTALVWLALHHVEHDGKSALRGEGMPFCEALTRYQIKILMTRVPFKQRHAMCESFLGPIPHCRVGTLPDGRRAMFEFRSPLKAIDPDGTERTRERAPKLVGFIEDGQD